MEMQVLACKIAISRAMHMKVVTKWRIARFDSTHMLLPVMLLLSSTFLLLPALLW